MSEENNEPVVEEEATAVVEKNSPVTIDMGMSDEEFENTNFDEITPEPEAVKEEEAPQEEAGIPSAEEEANLEEKEEEENQEGEEDSAPAKIDKAAEYDKIMAQFKANGKMTSVSSADEVRQLMKMGAGYNKKMAGLKSQQKFIKMLENHDLLDEEKISYLIDLDKKNPDAIAKLLKDSEIDPMDIDTESEAEYKPNAYTVDDSQVQLDTVLEDLQDSEGYATTIDIVGNKWDDTSRATLAANPAHIRTLNDHVENGIYDKVIPVIEKERMLGQLQGVDDFTAYKLVSDAMNAKGLLNQKPIANDGDVIAPPAKKTAPNVNDKKRAASAPKAKPRAAVQPVSITDMSDEEFEKKFGAGL